MIIPYVAPVWLHSVSLIFHKLRKWSSLVWVLLLWTIYLSILVSITIHVALYCPCHRLCSIFTLSNKQTPWLLVRKWTILTEQPLPTVKKCWLLWVEDVAWSAQRIPTAINLGFSRLEPLLFLSSCSSVILTRPKGPRSRPTTSQRIWECHRQNDQGIRVRAQEAQADFLLSTLSKLV
jgi:hypothetical protein